MSGTSRNLPVGVEAAIGGGFEAGSDQHGLLARPGDAPDLAGLPARDEKAAEVVPGQAVAAVEPTGNLGRLSVVTAVRNRSPEVKSSMSSVVFAVHDEALGVLDLLVLLAVVTVVTETFACCP